MRNKAKLLFFLLSFLTAQPSSLFTAKLIEDNLDRVESAISVDLDQDGDMDVVYAVYGSDKIQWEKNDGNQNFTTLVIDDNINNPESIVAIDLDQDGDMDIVSNHTDFNRIVWYENDGNQNFTEQVISTNADGHLL